MLLYPTPSECILRVSGIRLCRHSSGRFVADGFVKEISLLLQEQEQGSDGQHVETDEYCQLAPTTGPAGHVQQPIRRRGGISAEHVSEEEATSYVKKVSTICSFIIIFFFYVFNTAKNTPFVLVT